MIWVHSSAMSVCKRYVQKSLTSTPHFANNYSKKFTIDEVLKTLHVVQTSFDNYFEDLIEYR